MVIYLDMDGVVSDAHRAFLKALGREDLVKDYPAGEFNTYKAAGVSEKAMWSAVGKAGRELWSKMRVLPWAHELYEKLSEIGDVVFLTSPTWDPESLAGKLEWLQRFTKRKDFRDYVVTNRKDLLAGPGVVLIDDRPENCRSFRAAGGRAILFPAAWQGSSEDNVWDGLLIVVAHIKEMAKDGETEVQKQEG